MAQIMIKNSKPIEQVKDVVRLWDLFTNTIARMERSKYLKLSKSNKPQSIGNAPPVFFRRFYILDDFPGQKIEMYHLKSLSSIDVLTLPLLQEIQKRNPVVNQPVFENGVKVKDSFSLWEKYLISREELSQIKTPAAKADLNISELVAMEVEKQMSKKKQVIDEINDTKESKPTVIESGEIDDNSDNETIIQQIGEIDDKPKRGRRKKA